MTRTVYADVLRPSAKPNTLIYDSLLILAGSLGVGLAAQISVRLPFTPVPITLQSFAVLLVGALLGSRRGALALLAYLAEGSSGLPVFAGGAFGAAVLLGPTGGYLAGFAPAAFLTGRLAERGWDRSPARAFAAMLLGSTAIFALGVPWLAMFVGAEAALTAGLLPFLAGDIVKAALAAAALPAGWKLLKR